jgi:hypothetical protein
MTIDEAISAIREVWAFPLDREPKIRAILEQLVPEQVWCGKRTWPYTEHNVCVLKPGHSEPKHKDDQGREFV